MTFPCPAFGVCGYSGSGKTTLIEALVRRLGERGLRVGVIKQDAHGLSIDREGKDTDRLFKAGADVFIQDARQTFERRHRREEVALDARIRALGPRYDLILVEGHKGTPLPFKLWLHKAGEGECPAEAVGITRTLGWNDDREGIALDLLEAWLPDAWRAAPVYAGILIGGGSTRMGRPKHLIEDACGTPWLHTAVSAVRNCVDQTVILGKGDVPAELRTLAILPDVVDAQGPLRGMRAAMRWAPFACWVFVACDLPFVSEAAVRWLLEYRQPGVWAVLPRLSQTASPEPLLAYYDLRSASLIESVERPCDCALDPKTVSPVVPAVLTGAWRNVNTPEELAHTT